MIITKTDFMVYQEASIHLWALKNKKISDKKTNDFLKHLAKQGYEVEKYAKEYIKEVIFPLYKITKKDVFFQIKEQDQSFEATCDCLVKNPATKKWDIFEIKSSNEVKKEHYYDVTFQTLIFEKKYQIGEIFVLHLNKNYIRKGDLDLNQLFTRTNVSKKVDSLKKEVEIKRQEALIIAESTYYKQLKSCYKPKECPCLEICHPNLSSYSIYDINRISKSKIDQLRDDGIENILDTPDNFPLTDKQSYQVYIAKINQPVVKEGIIKQELSKLKYPLYFIDYETFEQAIPAFDGYKPHDHLSFQWSLHIQRENNKELEHYQFIETKRVDPINSFLSSLEPLIGKEGSIIVWNKTFEKGRNQRMGEINPKFKKLCQNMNNRIYDLMEIFQNNLYVDPAFKGSYSIKKVLPVLIPELSYDDMEITEGATAMIKWYQMTEQKTSESEKEKIKQELLKYCELDTYAMFKVYQKLTKNNVR